jgi:DNA primase catalytic core
MARIPDNELERVKAAVSLERLCQGYGIELKPQGKDLVGRCPFHADKTPSFIVTPAKNLWHCLGACGIGGDNIQLVMRQEKISFRHAVEKLQQMAGLAPAPAVLKTRRGTEHPVLAESSMADHALLRHVADFYHTTFLNQPQAMAYLQKRCCFHPEAVKAFRIGFANRTLGYRVPATTAEGKKLKAQLQRLGILRESGHEHLNGSVVVPIFESGPDGQLTGNVAQMYGRKLTPNLRPGTPDHLYLPGEHRAVWNAAALTNQTEWLVCESLIDALTMWGAGLRNVTCAYGVNGWTEAHTRLVETIRPARVILCLDNDEAGNQASMRLAEVLKEKGVTVLRAKLPPGADINDVARTHAKNPSSALAACIEKAEVLARPAGEPRKHVAMVVDEMTGAPLPIVDHESLTTGVGWAPEPFVPAPYEEVMAQREEAAKKKAPVSEPAPIQAPEPVAKESGCATSGDEHTFTFGERSWRVRGLAKNLSFESIKVQLRAMRGNCQSGSDRFHLDTLDMCNAKHRHGFVTQAAEETGLAADILKRDIGAILLRLEELQEALIRKTVEPQTKEVSLAEGERETALALLRNPQLLDRILADYERCGIVGEATNKLVGYLAAVSRKLDEPLAVIIQSTSAAGKSSLMEAILAFVPEEERLQYSAMTGQSLYYLGDADLKHKVLAVVEEEGAERASYALKLLQSEHELTIASTGKDPVTGRMVTQEYRVEGPVMIMLTTTAIDIDEELMNRCLVITVDESREQTRAIHALQREKRTLEGVRRKLEKAAILATHRNAQRLLRPLRVVNPFARQLTFLDDRTRTRRDHEKYLTLIEAIAFLHQYQRPVQRDGRGPHGQTEYVEVIAEDIATANRIAGEVLGRSLDELPPQTRRLLALIAERVDAECKRLKIERGSFRFSRRDVRGWIGWSDTALKIHLHRLEEMEYLLVHRAARGQSYVYEMLYAGEGQDGNRFVMGLLDASQLTTSYDGDRSGQNGHPSAPGQGVVRGEPGPDQPCLNGLQACVDAGAAASLNGKKACLLHGR